MKTYLEKLKRLSGDVLLEPESRTEIACTAAVGSLPIPVSEVTRANGRKMLLLKTQLTSACERDCYYCPFRAGRSTRRTTIRPEQLARAFMGLHRAGIVQGIFLSTGIIKGSITTQDRLIKTAEIIRKDYDYRGYIHLKIMPGAEKDQVRRSMELASRVSTNLESPNQRRLDDLAPMKRFASELLQPLKWIEQIRREESPHKAWNRRWPSSATQFVVGAVGESDLELLSTSDRLYAQTKLRRVYYSAFTPIRDTPLDHLPAEDPLRQHRLYQASFMLRDYPFSLEDLPFQPDGSLPRQLDPKSAWAAANLHEPLELNRAARHELLRVPGFGPKAAAAILSTRRQHKLTSLSDLHKLGIRSLQRAAPYILLDGRRPESLRQLSLFEEAKWTAGTQHSTHHAIQ